MSYSGPAAQEELARQARNVLAGGVSASMRMHPYLDRPVYMSRGDGPRVYDLEGNEYIDFNMSNGATMLGHNHPATREAIVDGLNDGSIAAAETAHHEALARELTEIIPSAERVRFASTGTEVTTVAVRLARHATGRTKILKFDGHFHGLSEPFLFKQDPASPDGTPIPSSGGVPERGAEDVIVIPWNDSNRLDQTLRKHRGEIAAVILEPVHFNGGCIPPEPGFLELLRERTRSDGTILIFDEVLSGFRTDLGGIQAASGVTPDLSTFAKALANGMPLSALVGRADLMEQLAPGGPVAHSGTYSGHILCVMAALATLKELRQPGLYDQLRETSQAFYRDLQEIFDRRGTPVQVQGLGARFGLYFGRREPVRRSADAAGHAHEMNRRFVVECLQRGVYFHAYSKQGPPGHAGFSFAHSDQDLSQALTVIDEVAAGLAGGR